MDHWLELIKNNGTSIIYELRLKSPTLGIGKQVALTYAKEIENFHPKYRLFIKTEQSNNDGKLFSTAKNFKELDKKLYERIMIHAEALSKEKNLPLEVKV